MFAYEVFSIRYKTNADGWNLTIALEPSGIIGMLLSPVMLTIHYSDKYKKSMSSSSPLWRYKSDGLTYSLKKWKRNYD